MYRVVLGLISVSNNVKPLLQADTSQNNSLVSNRQRFLASLAILVNVWFLEGINYSIAA